MSFFGDTLDFFRTVPWLVWIAAFPAVIFIRNAGLACVQRAHEKYPDSKPHHKMMLVLATIAMCAAVLTTTIVSYRFLST